MAKTAREEGFSEIADWFETLAKAEKSHAGRFAKAQHALSRASVWTLGSWLIGTARLFTKLVSFRGVVNGRLSGATMSGDASDHNP